MTAVLDLLRQLRAVRRSAVLRLQSISERDLTAHVGPTRSDDVRAVLLSLAQDDDRRCVATAGIFATLGWRPTEAQGILASLAQTRGQLRAAVVGLTDDLLDRAPEPGEWSVRQALQHLANNERRFVGDTPYAIERLRSREPLPLERPGEARGAGTLGHDLPGDLEVVLETAETVREQVVAGALDLGDEELTAPTPWGGREVEVRFMLHRRATHERQHLAQIMKTLQRLGFRQSEAQMLLGQAEIARAVLEGAVIGVPDHVARRKPGTGPQGVEQLLQECIAEERIKLATLSLGS